MVPNGSPYYRGKIDVRVSHMVARVVETGLPLVYLNMVGGQDDQMFDGGSFVLNPHGALAAQFPVFEEHVGHVDFEHDGERWAALPGEVHVHPDAWEQDYRVMVEATRALLRQVGVLEGRAGPLGRDRLGARRRDRGGRAGARGGALRDAALGVHVGALAGGRRRGRPQARLPA